MSLQNILRGSSEGQSGQAQSDEIRLLQKELEWRKAPPAPLLPDRGFARAVISRWSGTVGAEPTIVRADFVSTDYMISKVMCPMKTSISLGRTFVRDGDFAPGEIIVTNPNLEKSRAIYRSDFDVVRLYLPQSLIAECARDLALSSTESSEVLFDHHESDDPIIHHLITSLIEADSNAGSLGAVLLDSIGLTFAAHLLSRYSGLQRDLFGRNASRLANWRLNRVIEYIQEHLADNISLADLSDVAQLSRMHFAAQFKAATGSSPHTYILDRRIDAAKRLLAGTKLPIQEIAVAVGFKTQAHFTNVFRRIAGMSPSKWRRFIE